MTCGIALRRVIIIRNDSITHAIAMPSVARVTVLASCEIGSARLNENTTSTMPISIVVGMLIRPSTSHCTSSLRISRCSSHGSSDDLQHQRQRRRKVQVRLCGRVRDDRGRQRKRQALRGEQVDQRQHAALREHREREQQQDRREQVDELRVERERRSSASCR